MTDFALLDVAARGQGSMPGRLLGAQPRIDREIEHYSAQFGLTEIRLGLWPFLVYRAVANAIGERRTLELSLTGRTFHGREAREMGLAHEVAEDAAARAADIARAVAAFSPTALQNGMDFVQRVRGLDWHQAGAIAREARNRQFAGEDFQEGIRAFREKRKPRWPSLGDADA